MTWEKGTCIIALFRLECVGCSGLSLHVNNAEIGRIEKHEGSYELKKTSTFVEIKKGKELVCSLSLKNPKEPITKKFLDCIAVTVNEYSCTITYRKEKNEGGNFFQSLFRKKGIRFGLLGLAIIALFAGCYFLCPVFKNEKVVVWEMTFALDQGSKNFGSSIKGFDLIDGGEFFGMIGDTLYLSLDRKALKNLPETKSEVEQVLQNMRVSISFAEGGSSDEKVDYEEDNLVSAFTSLSETVGVIVAENKAVSSKAYNEFKSLEQRNEDDSTFVISCKSYCDLYNSNRDIIAKVENLLWNRLESSNDTTVLNLCKEVFTNLEENVNKRIAAIREGHLQEQRRQDTINKIKQFITSLKTKICSKQKFHDANVFYNGLSRQYKNYIDSEGLAFSGYITAYKLLYQELAKNTPQYVPFMEIVNEYPSYWGENAVVLNLIIKNSNTFSLGASQLKNGKSMSEVHEVFNNRGLEN